MGGGREDVEADCPGLRPNPFLWMKAADILLESYKRKQIQKDGVLILDEGLRLTTLKEFAVRGDRKEAKTRARANEGEPTQRRCRRCSEAGHNTRTCK